MNTGSPEVMAAVRNLSEFSALPKIATQTRINIIRMQRRSSRRLLDLMRRRLRGIFLCRSVDELLDQLQRQAPQHFFFHRQEHHVPQSIGIL